MGIQNLGIKFSWYWVACRTQWSERSSFVRLLTLINQNYDLLTRSVLFYILMMIIIAYLVIGVFFSRQPKDLAPEGELAAQ